MGRMQVLYSFSLVEVEYTANNVWLHSEFLSVTYSHTVSTAEAAVVDFCSDFRVYWFQSCASCHDRPRLIMSPLTPSLARVLIRHHRHHTSLYCIWWMMSQWVTTNCLTYYYCSSRTLQRLANSLLLGCGDGIALRPELSVRVDVVASDAEVDKITPLTRKKSYSASGLNCALLVWLIWVICSCM